MRDEVLHLTKGNIPPVSRYFSEKSDFQCVHGMPFDSECEECNKIKERPIVPHYQSGGIEPIDFINSHNFNFNIGNCIKYCSRAGLKGDAVTDLKKAIDYLNFEIERLKNETK